MRLARWRLLPRGGLDCHGSDVLASRDAGLPRSVDAAGAPGVRERGKPKEADPFRWGTAGSVRHRRGGGYGRRRSSGRLRMLCLPFRTARCRISWRRGSSRLDSGGEVRADGLLVGPAGLEHEFLLAVPDQAAVAFGQEVLHDDGDRVLVEVRSRLCGAAAGVIAEQPNDEAANGLALGACRGGLPQAPAWAPICRREEGASG
jgi:hypothetical protein